MSTSHPGPVSPPRSGGLISPVSCSERGKNRHLAVFNFTDMVGYTAATRADEKSALARRSGQEPAVRPLELTRIPLLSNRPGGASSESTQSVRLGTDDTKVAVHLRPQGQYRTKEEARRTLVCPRGACFASPSANGYTLNPDSAHDSGLTSVAGTQLEKRYRSPIRDEFLQHSNRCAREGSRTPHGFESVRGRPPATDWNGFSPPIYPLPMDRTFELRGPTAELPVLRDDRRCPSQ
jgi:hypothetical protein